MAADAFSKLKKTQFTRQNKNISDFIAACKRPINMKSYHILEKFSYFRHCKYLHLRYGFDDYLKSYLF